MVKLHRVVKKMTRSKPALKTPDHAAEEWISNEEKILQAARSLFSRKGFAAVTTQEVADKAGVDKRLVFYHFQTKENLYLQTLAVFFHRIETLMKNFSPAKHQPADPWLSLLQFSDNFTTFVAQHQEPIRILIREIMDDGPFLDLLTKRYFQPLFEVGNQILKDMFRGQKKPEQQLLHFLISFGGANLLYFMIEPLLRRLGTADPLDAENLEKRKEEMRRLIARNL
jgi:AcrR family transcriptional regulator